jgi:hypothetical protein
MNLSLNIPVDFICSLKELDNELYIFKKLIKIDGECVEKLKGQK